MNSIRYIPTGRFNAAPEGPHQHLSPAGELLEAEHVRAGTFDPMLVDENQNLRFNPHRLNAAGDVNDTAVGFQIAIDTLTYIRKQVTEQKFYEVGIPDFVPLSVGEGAFSQSILTNLTFNNSDDFATGIINQGLANARLASADAAVASKVITLKQWAKQVTYSLFEVQQALVANSWDIIEGKHRARKKNWDLGIQQLAFLGVRGDATALGLFNQSAVNTNTTFITEYINVMDPTEFATFVAGLLQLYFANTASTALPNRFVIPTADYLGLATPVSPTYPTVSKLTYLLQAMQQILGPDFKLMHTAYADKANNNALTGLNKNVYALYRHDPESIRMDIPVDYTVTQPNSVNNFQFNDVAYGQFGSVGVYRNLELLYFTF